MSNSKQTSNRSKIRAGQTYYRVVNIYGERSPLTLTKETKMKLRNQKRKFNRIIGRNSFGTKTLRQMYYK